MERVCAGAVGNIRNMRRLVFAAFIIACLSVTNATGQMIDTSNGIDYHNGSVWLGPHNVYFIWYGNWSGNSATTILPQFISDLNHSLYFNTNITYGIMSVDQSGTGHIFSEGIVSNSVTFAGQIFDSYSNGTSLSQSGVESVVSRALVSGLPTDANGLYFVLTSADVGATTSDGSFCQNFCGYHSNNTIRGAGLKYAFVGNTDRCGGGCISNNPPLMAGPNGNQGADAMASIMAHELNETVTDPEVNPLMTGWYRTSLGRLGEVGDLCSFNFGTPTGFAGNGAPFNLTLNGRHYLIQKNYVNAPGVQCAMAFATPSGTPAKATIAVTGDIGCDPTGGCEAGTVQFQLIIQGHTGTETLVYDGTGVNGDIDAHAVATDLANLINIDPNINSLVLASVVQGPQLPAGDGQDWWINLASRQNGVALNNNQWSIAISPFGGTPFQNTTLALTPSVGSLVGGADPCCSQ